jgi:hypothetical protein
MTTKVTVEANHGWPVKVTAINPETGNPVSEHAGTVVPANGALTFYVHRGQDLLVHEIQPNETKTIADEA